MRTLRWREVKRTEREHKVHLEFIGGVSGNWIFFFSLIDEKESSVHVETKFF